MSAPSTDPAPAARAGGPAPPPSYLDALTARLAEARAANVESLVLAARLVEEAVAGDGIVYVFGSGHSQLAALELNRRAGGLAPLQVILDPTWGVAERIEGFGAALVADLGFGPPDCLVVISSSGSTRASIEIARTGQARGVPVIAVTSMAASRSAASEPPSVTRLCDLADVVLDNPATGRDSAVRVEPRDVGLAQTSTVVAAALLHEVVVSAIAGLVRRGLDPPVLRANAEAGGREYNAKLFGRYRGRLQRVP
jgi:uncharacterized phosphosugar-binding protein